MNALDSSVTQIDRLGPRVDVDLALYVMRAAEERSICVTVGGGMPGSGLEPPPSPDTDRFALASKFKGRIVRVRDSELILNVDGDLRTVRLLMPTGLDFTPLLKHTVEVAHRLEINPMRSTTVDLSIRNAHGDLLFWARDGALPHQVHCHGLQVRVAVQPDECYLMFQCNDGPKRLPGAATAVLNTHIGRFVALGVRVEENNAAFALVRKYF